MGTDFYIEDEQIRLTNSYWHNEFLNWTAEQGEYPQILNHSPIHGSYLLDEDEPPDLYSGSVQKLQTEIDRLLERDPPDFAKHILKQMLRGCKLALKRNQKITMDDGAWKG